ncbi:Protein of uncharacterised function (DUF2510) [Mycobacteroides abscessus subsp. bolletii]|uniref:DUF2510 domain-containing protein n=1 Tax=Mycobacteroides abscessus TaxID=36809 RepID=UPI0009D4801F|nr:DUF2510 domain-containing protein [Mycobacteroides abscessus]SKG74857.1 Protein of uncharacterised function (DUF2510) [Mycobacteroides abscessus subsp. bolletii]SKH26237.1 Protein of uncharacterised function (DUF2510) [Mycobacteroides abscessus subsp. bolletii]
MSNWFERRWAARTADVKKASKAPGWYPDPSDSRIHAYWNGKGWTAHKWAPDPGDADIRMFWDGAQWTGDRRPASEPPYMPPNVDPDRPRSQDTDWVKIGAIAFGAAAVVNVVLKDQDRALASWDRARAQSDAYARQDRVRQYQMAYNNWVQRYWNNPNPPPPPRPPTY